MARFVQALRFTAGLAMVGGGVALMAPAASEIAARTQGLHAVPAATPTGWADQHTPAPAAAHAIPDPLSEPPPPAAWAVDVATTAPPPREPYTPPPPPPPLPASFPGVVQREGGLEATYRSTLRIPPPPLLDAHRPPPLAAGWTAHEVAPPPVAEMPAAVVPQTYVIRDGDDLTGIATRFYGHASAATAIWSANRAALPDPHVLPIGAAITLPPAWTVHAARQGDPRAIEPRPAGGPPAMPDPALAMTAARPVGWLTGDRPPAASPAAGGAAPPQRPGSVRVAPGETLASLARRFYGDERMAARIWEANRDRLRSPELVVPGMELRLP